MAATQTKDDTKSGTHYLILGGNAAGMSAAVRIHKYDRQARITVLEKTGVTSFGACGIPYFVGGEFADIEQMTARPLQEFLQLGFDVRLHHSVTALDTSVKQVIALNAQTQQAETFSYDRLMIAVGAGPIIPPIPGVDAGIVHTMHSKQDALQLLEQLPHIENVVIIGSGFIGLEAAEAFTQRGKQVTIIESADRVMARALDVEITSHLEQALKRHQVTLRLNESVTAIHAQSVETSQGSYPADLVLLAVGFRPNTAFLREAGIALSKEGAVVIDNACRTNVPEVFAAGDCATVPHRISGSRYIPLATSANKMGRIAGETMAGKENRFIGSLGSSGVRVFDVEAGRTGITETEARQLAIDYATVVIQDKNHTDYVPGQSAMWVKLIYERDSRKLLGGQICGSFGGGAVLRVDALAVAIYSGLTVDELGLMDFIYAPPFARTWDILNIAGNVAK